MDAATGWKGEHGIAKADDEVWVCSCFAKGGFNVYVYHLPGQMGVFVDIQSYLFYYPCSKSRSKLIFIVLLTIPGGLYLCPKSRSNCSLTI